MRHAPSVQPDSYRILAFDSMPAELAARRPPAARTPTRAEMLRLVNEGAARSAGRTAESLEAKFPNLSRIRQA